MKKILFRKILLTDYSIFSNRFTKCKYYCLGFQAVNFLDIMIEDGRDYIVYVNYSLLNFPKIVSKLLPFAIFLVYSM